MTYPRRVSTSTLQKNVSLRRLRDVRRSPTQTLSVNMNRIARVGIE